MSEAATLEPYGALTEPATLTIERMLPGPIERIWTYLTDSDQRRRWLAAGEMAMEVGAPFELVWRNDELSEEPGQRPAGVAAEHRMESRILELEAPRRLVISWGAASEVAFRLEPRGPEVLLTLVHSRVPDRATLLNVASGWHMHLDVLAARMSGRTPPPFWDGWTRLKAEYDRRLPA